MTDLGKSNSGPKESDNRDKSLHGLMVALAMAGIIAGSVILFAYASSDGPFPDGAASAVNEVTPRPEPSPAIEKVVDEPVNVERIERIDSTVDVEQQAYVEIKELAYANTTSETNKEVAAYTEEEEAEESEYENEDEPESSAPAQSDGQGEKDDDLPEESELDDLIPKRLLGLLDEIVDLDDDEDEKEDSDDDGNKGKGHKHDDDD